MEASYTSKVNISKRLILMMVYLVVLIIAVYLVLTFAGQRTIVIGNSMYNTLENNDELWIDKLGYRFHEPKRFDIIVFPYQDSDTFYVKRIIGLPGEKVFISDDGHIFINDEMLEESYGYEPIDITKRGLAEEPIYLGDDEYFVLGDNRNGSKDSRDPLVGNIPRDIIEGKVVFRILPFKKFGKIE